MTRFANSLPCLVCAAVLAVLPSAFLRADDGVEEEGEDRFVRLMNAQSVRVLEINGKSYRKAEGSARFLHNNTWLICDTAVWDVDDQIIHAMGHVSLEQETTELTSDSLNYFVERNVAEFRGSLVQLKDKDGNTLRTRNLDYNTKDSVGVFRDGGAMRDKDGQLMESLEGRYDSKVKQFEFTTQVNMFTDSVFVLTSVLDYDSESSVATFPAALDAWKDDNMLSSDSGWWNRDKELFFFKGNVHAMNEKREGWSDSLYVDRAVLNVEMMGNAQVNDSSREVTALAGCIYYTDSLSRVDMSDDPVVLLENMEKDKDGVERKDTVYFRADNISYWTLMRYMIDQGQLDAAKGRIGAISSDPVENIREKAREEAEKRKQEAIDKDPFAPPELKSGYSEKKDKEEDWEIPEEEEEGSSLDKYLKPSAEDDFPDWGDGADGGMDGAVEAADSSAVAEVRDSTKTGFMEAGGRVRLFRTTLQAACDSMAYTDLDSLSRLFGNPVIWNDVKHQYNSDSMYLSARSGKVDRAYLLSNAFIHIDEGEKDFFDQIKSAEMTAFFEGEGQLRRFDAMGGASAIFFMREKERISTANKKEAKILSAEFEDGDVRRISYFESPKSSVYPVPQMLREDRFLKGYRWTPDLRPESPASITSRVPRSSERAAYEVHPRPKFIQTERFFRGYMAKVYKVVESSDSLRRMKSREAEKEDSLAAVLPVGTSLAVLDTVKTVLVDSLASVAPRPHEDSLSLDVEILDLEIALLPVPVIDSLLAEGAVRRRIADSIAAIKTPEQLAKEARLAAIAQRKAEIQARRAAREAAREARWDALDARDALKQAARDAKKHERRDRKEQSIADAMSRREEKENRIRDKYIQKYLKRYTRHGIPAGLLSDEPAPEAAGQSPSLPDSPPEGSVTEGPVLETPAQENPAPENPVPEDSSSD